ncbi:MAG: recombinase family protein, partial [Clostridia bacterium]|nr:recombinase family protein [Clostridia bacterium]
MARRSRRNALPEETGSERSCRAAVYIRLSVEDSQTGSASVETQQYIIGHFLESHPDIEYFHTYIDNGLTGTNFNRPAFQSMLNDIETGAVNCVVVKDLSRLGRNSIDTGYYIEQYFPQRKVRFIAVNEGYDTADGNGRPDMMIALRNMVNEAYAADISRKITAAHRQMRKDGKFIGALPPYGYLKAPEDCHKLIVDPEAAAVVKQIFAWAANGMGINTIATRLNEAGVMTPSYRRAEQGLITNEKRLGSGNWQTFTVKKILRTEIYTGDMVQGKSKIVARKQIPTNPDEYTVVPGTHQSIVSRELFEHVRGILDRTAQICRERKKSAYSPNLLKGKIFCTACGRPLHRQREKRKKTADQYFYYCTTNTQVKQDSCPGVIIYEKELFVVLLTVIRKTLESALGESSVISKTQAEDQERQLAVIEQEIRRRNGQITALYENLTIGANFKPILSQYESYTALAFGIDLAGTFMTDNRGFMATI